jgi:hypothetical protein
MAYAAPGAYNTFVPSFDATGHLTASFSRNPKDFSVNKYAALTSVKKSVGYFMRITAEVAARVINSDLAEFVWPDGNDAPSGEWNTETFSWFPYSTQRYVYAFRLGYKANEQADWKVLAAHAEFAAQQAMTARTLKVFTALTTTSNYDSSHTSTATSLGGGFWSAGTANSPVIKKALNAMAQVIQKDTVGALKPYNDLILVIDPVLADAMGRSQEVHSYLQQSQFALAQVRGDTEGQNAIWGLPDRLYGFKIVVEDAVRVTSKKGATRAASYIGGGNTAVMCARPGGLTSPAGGPSFSTAHVMAYEEMTVEQRDDPDNRRIQGRVVDDFDVQIVAPATGYVLTAVLS